jgi:hypothetical protein
MVTANAFNKHDSLLAGRDPNLDDQYSSITFLFKDAVYFIFIYLFIIIIIIIIIIYVFVEKVFFLQLSRFGSINRQN